jgi:hypothetical protein
MTPMFASIRKYNEAPTFADDLVKRQEEVMSVLRPIRGFHAYYLIKTNDGVTSVTVCDDRAGVEESNRVAAGWLKEKLPTFASRPPEITTGEVRMHLNSNQPEKVTV